MAIRRSELWQETFSSFWWWAVGHLVWGGVLYAIAWDWKVFLAGASIITLFFGMEAAFRIIRRREEACEVRVADAKKDAQKEWEKKSLEVQERNDERDIPEVIKEMRDASNEERKRLGIINQNHRGDENWYVKALSQRRGERIVRKAFKEWKKDNLR